MRSLGVNVFVWILGLAFTAASPPVQAQTFIVLHNFTGLDGSQPYAAVTLDRGGNLYGTTYAGGSGGAGTVYQLKHQRSGWTLNLLHSFSGGSDGAAPFGRVVLGRDGALYGTAAEGGSNGYGTVFKLRPLPFFCRTVLCPWTETVLYAFQGGADGQLPYTGGLLFDTAGNIYGTTYYGGSGLGVGVIYELTPSGSGWSESVLHTFGNGYDGREPANSMAMDSAGNLYGTSETGGQTNAGVIFQLARGADSSWTETVLHSFQYGIDGAYPSGVVLDSQSGNLYGATGAGGPGEEGTAYELSSLDGTFSVLFSFTGYSGCGPPDNLTLDAAGNLYGTTYCGGSYGWGSVFKLTPSSPYWIYTSLHDFTAGADGGEPAAGVTMDSAGNLYGTTTNGGNGHGVVWEITP